MSETPLKEVWNVLDTTGIGPQQLLTYTLPQVQHCMEGQIELFEVLLHGRCRTGLRQIINKKSARKKKEVQEGKLTRAIKLISGQT